jgi:pimeloyl-ACP methyl ester carboxylesterase
MEKRIVEIDGYKLAVYIQPGRAIPIVCLHGLSCSHEEFAEIFKNPIFSKHKIIAPDFLGHGNSAKPRDFSYTLKDHKNIIKKLLKKLRVKHYILIGHSLGGSIGTLLARSFKPKLFINVEGCLLTDDCGLRDDQFVSSQAEAIKAIIPKEMSNRVLSRDKKTLKLITQISLKTSPFAWYHSAFSLVEWCESKKILSMYLNMTKTHFIYGKQTRRKTISLLKNKKVNMTGISKSGHFSMLDNPSEFYETVFGLIHKHFK